DLGLVLGGGSRPGTRDYAKLGELVRRRADAHLIGTLMLRSMPLAVYSEKNIGHFGLAFPAYTHFTSPIRRYPDLLVHRAIRQITGKHAAYPYDQPEMHRLGEHCSLTERRADEATRDAVQRLKCIFMQDKVGETFNGTISGVTGFGLFVELDELYVEGLVHVTSLPNDYYHFDPIRHELRGERRKRRYSLSGRVRVQVARVDVDDRKIDFALIEEPGDATLERRGDASRLRSRRRRN
ncbi:MAG: RNB domain-containing ribonuclease, partial [Gammaproteobacteria bacterium]|nr:RNB domain-containing ribonuclease [Gammaproteobacteria bacterium]